MRISRRDYRGYGGLTRAVGVPGQPFPASAPVASDRTAEYGYGLQNELDAMHAAAKKPFRNSRPGDCSYCGKWIKCDMYRHVYTYHLDLGQLLPCPVLWCTVWKGTPQDCMDHVRRLHDVMSDIKSATHGLSGARFGWMLSNPAIRGFLLMSCCSVKYNFHLCITTEYSSVVASLCTRLRVFMLQTTALAQCDMASPVPGSSVSPHHDHHCDVETEPPRKTRRVHHRMRPTRVRE